MIIIRELTRLQVELKAKIKYNIAPINSSHFRISTICHHIFGFDTPFVLRNSGTHMYQKIYMHFFQ